MYSIRRRMNKVLWMGLAALVTVGGCQVVQRTPGPEPLNNSPLTIDGAMQLRDWQPTSAVYKNDMVVAGPTYAPVQAKSASWPVEGVTETGAFVIDLVYLPAGLFIDAPWKDIAYKSLATPATYTAMPPLPQGAETVKGYPLQ